MVAGGVVEYIGLMTRAEATSKLAIDVYDAFLRLAMEIVVEVLDCIGEDIGKVKKGQPLKRDTLEKAGLR
jgi:hypothetical protein